MSVGEIMGYLLFNSRTSGASAETADPAFCRSASSKINGAFDLTNSVKKSRSSVEKHSTLNQLTAGKKHSAWSKPRSTGRSTATRTVPSSLA